MSSTANAACANCGKAEEDDNKLKTCTSCKMVKYCSRDCQRSHWPKHKKACKKRAAELFDEELFKDTEEREECPICMLPLPFRPKETMFQSCCGKSICCGCIHAQRKEGIRSGKAEEHAGACSFCREPHPDTEEIAVTRLKSCMAKNNAQAIHCFASCYMRGEMGFPRDRVKGRELLLKAGELGCADGYADLAFSYKIECGGEFDLKKQRQYFELAAMKGNIPARNNLGCLDLDAGDRKRAFKHFAISAKAGFESSLNAIKDGYKEGYVTKDEYSEILHAYQKKQEDMKSEMRDEFLVYRANPRLYWV